MLIPPHLKDALPSTTSPFTTASTSITLITFNPYTINASSQPSDSLPNWPIYLGITLGTLGLACLLSLGLWIRSHRQRRSAKERKNSMGEEPLPLYQAAGISVNVPVVEPPPPAYTVATANAGGAQEQGVVDVRGEPPAYMANGEGEGVHRSGVVIARGGVADSNESTRS